MLDIKLWVKTSRRNIETRERCINRMEKLYENEPLRFKQVRQLLRLLCKDGDVLLERIYKA